MMTSATQTGSASISLLLFGQMSSNGAKRRLNDNKCASIIYFQTAIERYVLIPVVNNEHNVIVS